MIRDRFVITVRTLVEAQVEDEFNEWQFEEHVPWILSVDGYTSVRRYKNVEMDQSYVNLWTLDTLAAHDCDDHEKKSKSPWGRRLKRYRQLQVEFYERVQSAGLIPDIGDNYLSIVRFRVEERKEKALVDWIKAEQLDKLVADGAAYAALYQRARNGDGFMLRADFTSASGRDCHPWTSILKKIDEEGSINSVEAYLSMADTAFTK